MSTAGSGEREHATGKITVRSYEPSTYDRPDQGPALVRIHVEDQGTLAGQRVVGEWFVVPGSGTGELAGLRGEGGFEAELGQGADITLDYWFE